MEEESVTEREEGQKGSPSPDNAPGPISLPQKPQGQDPNKTVSLIWTDEYPDMAPIVGMERGFTFVEPEPKLSFKTDDGQVFSVRSGDIVGRNQAGSEVLQLYPTVSRYHIHVRFRDGGWHIKNLSDNGTWLNNHPIPQGQEAELNPMDELNLSSKCHLLVLP
jgi:hypothetical protein